MQASIRVYISGRGVDVPAGSSLLDALRSVDPEAARAVEDGRRAIADSRGLPVPADSAAFSGAILRVISARHAHDVSSGTSDDGTS